MAKRKVIAPNYLERVPRRRADRPWRVKEDGTVEVDLEHTGFFAFIAQRFFRRPRVSRIALDRYGSVVWQSIDGVNTIMDIVRVMENAFPAEKERMLDRVVTYMATLQRTRFITVR